MNNIQMKCSFDEIDYQPGDLLRDLDNGIWVLGKQETRKMLWVAVRLRDGWSTQLYEQVADLCLGETLTKIPGNFTITIS